MNDESCELVPSWIALIVRWRPRCCPLCLRGAGIENPRVRKVVGEGLDWLAYNQHKLGHWTAQGRYPTAMTALAGIAMLCEGSTTTQGKYAENIRRAVDYLVRQSRPNGLIGDPLRDDRYTYGHGFSMLFLSQVLGDEEDEDRRAELVDVLTRAVRVHRPGADAGRRLGLCQRQGRRRLRRRLDHDHASAGPARLPQRGHSRAEGDHRQGGEVHQGLHAARRRRAIQLEGRRRPARDHGRGHRLPVQRRRIRQTISCRG